MALQFMTVQFMTVQFRGSWVILLIMLLASCTILSGCVGETRDTKPNNEPHSTVENSVAHKPEDLNLCVAPSNITLLHIEDVITWINAMPKPLTLACFIASLPRPVYYNSTISNFSAQPSIGRANPRIFLNFNEGLWLSFVPQEAITTQTKEGITHKIWDQDGIQLLELSEEVTSHHTSPQSIKGELAFPITTQLAPNAPYAHINFNADKKSSLCGGCHANETVIDSIEDVPIFRSAMLRNFEAGEVRHATLIDAYLTCDDNLHEDNHTQNEWYRCQMYEATFGRGTMLWRSFREDIETQ